MDQALRDKIKNIYEDFLRDEPLFEKSFAQVKLTVEAEQTQGKNQVVEKDRTIGDMINLPRDQDEMKIAAAAKSGLLNPSELERAGKQKADATNVNNLVDVLENRAAERSRDIDLPKLREEKLKEAAKEEAAQQAKDKEEAQKKPRDGFYGVLKEMQEKMSEKPEQDKVVDKDQKKLPPELQEVAEAFKRAGAHSEKVSGDELKPQKTIVTAEVQDRKKEEAKNITKLHPRDGG
jgi:hypothetical protein